MYIYIHQCIYLLFHEHESQNYLILSDDTKKKTEGCGIFFVLKKESFKINVPV